MPGLLTPKSLTAPKSLGCLLKTICPSHSVRAIPTHAGLQIFLIAIQYFTDKQAVRDINRGIYIYT